MKGVSNCLFDRLLMAFVNCRLNEEELREYDPGYPYMGKAFIPKGGTIDRDNNMRLFNYGNGPIREPSDLYQFIFDYKGIQLRVQFRQVLNDYDVYWRDCFIEKVEDFRYNYEDVKQALRDAMKVYAYTGYSFIELMSINDKSIIHIDF